MLTCWDGRLKHSTRIKVHPSQWDRVAQRPIVSRNDAVGRAKLIRLNRIFEAIEQLRTTCTVTGDRMTRARAREVVDAILDKKPVEKNRKSFEPAAREIIEEMKSGALLNRQGKRYSKGTLKNYGQSLDALLAFSAEKKISLEFSDVTQDTYNKLVEWCHAQGWALNYTGQHIKNWKRIMEVARVKGWHHNRIYEETDFKTLKEETFDIALDEKELEALRTQKVRNREHDIARDWFIIGCYTALRVSDLKLLDMTKVDGWQIILANEKTDETVVIPVHPIVKSILKKWKGFPPLLQEQTINEKVKIVAKDAGIKGMVLYTVTEGGVRKDYYLQKWEMVSLHTARRSFITNARKNGIPDAIVMKLAGIRKPQTLQRYDKLSPSEAAAIAAGHSFFKK